MKLTQDQIEWLSNQDWALALPFQSVTQPIMIEHEDTGFTETFDILETRKGARIIMPRDLTP